MDAASRIRTNGINAASAFTVTLLSLLDLAGLPGRLDRPARLDLPGRPDLPVPQELLDLLALSGQPALLGMQELPELLGQLGLPVLLVAPERPDLVALLELLDLPDLAGPLDLPGLPDLPDPKDPLDLLRPPTLAAKRSLERAPSRANAPSVSGGARPCCGPNTGGWNETEQRCRFRIDSDKLSIESAPAPSISSSGKADFRRIAWERKR